MFIRPLKRTPEDCDQIARMMLPVMMLPDDSNVILSARCILTMGQAHKAAYTLAGGQSDRKATAALRKMIRMCRQIVSEPSLLAIVQRVAKVPQPDVAQAA